MMSDVVADLHGVSAAVTLLAFALAAIWGVVEYRRGARLSRRYDQAL